MIDRSDVDIEVFRRSRGAGGQHNNKTATSIRMTHRATGVRVEACSERSQRANLEAAYSQLAAKLLRLKEEARAAAAKGRHDAKPDAAFGAKLRTANLCERYVTDHVTGHKTADPQAYLSGKIDGFLRATMLQGARP